MRYARTVRHRFKLDRRSPWTWGYTNVRTPYVDRLRAAAFEPCWRTSPEGRAYVTALERVLQ